MRVIIGRIAFVLVLAIALFGGDGPSAAVAANVRATAKSGTDTQVCLHRESPNGRYSIVQRPSNGTARVVMSNQSSGGEKPIRVARVFYRSKPGFIGTDTLTYQRVNPNGTVDTFTLSVSVIP